MSILFALILLTALFFYQYYKTQNSQNTIGGAISKAKILWLGYAVFNYFVFSVWLYFHTPVDHTFRGILMAAMILFYCRFIVQGILMFILKKWQPPMGMAYNILCISVLGVFLIDLCNKNTINISRAEGTYFLYFIGLILTLMTDTYYAKTFFQIVGKRTMGADAIWYASDEDQKFRRINRITARLNTFFYALTTLVIYLMCNIL
jgi:hypothetical protein